jgi:hypothetical protein
MATSPSSFPWRVRSLLPVYLVEYPFPFSSGEDERFPNVDSSLEGRDGSLSLVIQDCLGGIR